MAESEATSPITAPDSVLGGQIRAILAAIGGSFVTKGYINNDLVEPLIGLAMVLIAAVWSWWQKRRTTKTIAIALEMPKGSTREQLNAVTATTDQGGVVTP